MLSSRRLLAPLAAALVLAAMAVGVPTAGAEPPEPRRFIITLRDSVADPAAVAAEHSGRFGADVAFVYRHALKGYAATFQGTGASEVASDARVARVEPDGVATISATTQGNATWGLDRIDQAAGLSGTFRYNNTGAGVTAYIIDTGINFGHSEFGERAVSGFDAFTEPAAGGDCNGHGTHVAGTVGGTTYGVAKGVSLVAVRVLDCAGSGTWSGVIAGIDWVVKNHVKPAVANMSLGGGANSSVDAAVSGMIASGVSTAVAAGNGNQGGVAQDACRYSPARVADAMTISATDKTDRKASFANYGNCVDWFAPGVAITSAWHSGGTNTISGTSMATPHTAGVVALHLQSTPAATPQQVRVALYDLATKGIVKSSKTANSHLLFTSY